MPFPLCTVWGLVLNRSGGDHHHAELQRVIAASPGLPEDALLPLVSLLGRRTLELEGEADGCQVVPPVGELDVEDVATIFGNRLGCYIQQLPLSVLQAMGLNLQGLPFYPQSLAFLS
ncbi:hypothetical protein INR49_014016 [Caranx melampygus]|nr:hypothetical protein INR49_014016 [Caranx melampygus]